MKPAPVHRILSIALRLVGMALAMFLIMGSSCEEESGGDTGASSPGTAPELVITEPQDDSTVSVDTVTIRGAAPPGAEVRHTKTLRDETFEADENGNWEYVVELDEGENEFDFKLSENDDAKAKLTITYDPDMGSATETSAPPEATATPEPDVASTWAAGTPVTQDAVAAILEDLRGSTIEASDYQELIVDEAAGAITIRYKESSFSFDEDATLRVVADVAYVDMKALFPNPSVQFVTVELPGKFIDQLGNSKEETAFSLTWSRAIADQADWDGLADVVVVTPEALFCVAEEYYIHPAIYDKLEDKGCLE